MGRVGVGVGERQAPDAAARIATSAAAAQLPDAPGGLLLFAGGTHCRSAEKVAEGARSRFPNATVAVVGSPTLLSERGEIEGRPAVLAIAFSSPFLAALAEDGDEALGMLGETLRHRPARPLMLFGRRTLSPGTVPAFAKASKAWALVGGGVDGSATLALGRPGEPTRLAPTLGLRIDGGLRMASTTTVGISMLSERQRVTEVQDGYVLRLAGAPPLEALSQAAKERRDRPLVLVALYRGDTSPVIRGIGGVDARRGALHLGEDIAVGDHLAFCTPDAQAARDDLEAKVRRLNRELRGGIPLGAMYFDSVGRGRRLHGRSGACLGILRRHLEGLPLAGLRTVSEIVRSDDELRLGGHCGVLSMLFAPS